MKAVMYHYVRDLEGPQEYPGILALDVRVFERQLDHFAAADGFLSQDEFITAVGHGSDRKGVVLTFDDGLRDHYETVFPILKERGLWGLFYVSGKPMVFPRLLNVHAVHLLLGRFSARDLYDEAVEILHAQFEYFYEDMGTRFDQEIYKTQNNTAYVYRFKRLFNYHLDSALARRVLAELLCSRFDVSERELHGQHYATTKELQEMEAAGMIIGAHSYGHDVMSSLSEEQLYIDVMVSMAQFQHHFNPPLYSFAYPYGGASSIDERVVEAVKRTHFNHAFMVLEKNIDDESIKDRFRLPRLDCNQIYA